MSAVSRKLPPPARNASMTRSAAAKEVVHPQFIVPRHSSETLRPVAPSGRYSISAHGIRRGHPAQLRYIQRVKPRISGRMADPSPVTARAVAVGLLLAVGINLVMDYSDTYLK